MVNSALPQFSLRVRVAAWSVAVMGAAIVLLAIIVTALFSAGLREGTDRLLDQDIDALRSLLAINESGQAELFSLTPDVLDQDELTRHLRFVIRARDGTVLIESPQLAGLSLPAPATTVRAPPTRRRDLRLGKETVRLQESVHTLRRGGTQIDVFIQALRSVQPFVIQEQRLNRLLWGILPFPIVLVFLGTWWLAGRSLRPLNHMIDTVRGIGAHELDRRLPVGLADEVGRLAATFNLLLARLAASFDSLKRFTADASHELRTPLAALRAQAEVILSRPRAVDAYREVLVAMLEELQRLEHMVERLLQLARGDAGLLGVQRRAVSLDNYLRDWVERYLPLAEEKTVSIDLRAPSLHLAADPALLDHAVANLLDNAIRYSPPGGCIQIDVECEENVVHIRFCDDGPGIPPAERERIFERFVRLDRSRAHAGAGLGLSLVRVVCALHGGHATVGDSVRGACLVISLPRRVS